MKTHAPATVNYLGKTLEIAYQGSISCILGICMRPVDVNLRKVRNSMGILWNSVKIHAPATVNHLRETLKIAYEGSISCILSICMRQG